MTENKRLLTDAKLASLTPDDLQRWRAEGRASDADLEAFAREWNASGKHFFQAEVRFGRILLRDREPDREPDRERPHYIKATTADLLAGAIGACLACGEHHDGIEPDAERYRCEGCGAHEVYGLEQLLIIGRLEVLE